MSKPRTGQICVLSAEEVEAWHIFSTEPSCSDHQHITSREANLLIYPWQTVNHTECDPAAKYVGRSKGRHCVQMLRTYTWAIKYLRSGLCKGIPGLKGTYGPGLPSQQLTQGGVAKGGKMPERSNGWPDRMRVNYAERTT